MHKVTKAKSKNKEIVKRMADAVIEEFNDILSSGQGVTAIEVWHEQELQKTYDEIPDNLKDEVYKAYLRSIGPNGMDPLDGEEEFIKKLFKK